MNTDLEEQQAQRQEMIDLGILKAGAIIREKAESAFVLGCIPGASAVAMPSQYTAVCTEIASAFGIKIGEEAIAEIVGIWIAGLAILPLTLIPVFAGALARDVVKDLGQQFLDSIVSVITDSSDAELYDSELVSMRLVNEIRQRKKR